ncbi:MAG: hypothetical protein GY760_25930 [Deltaproteobacteria bacterium]|jgi:hypothetical protein|nr:hypothetical protein [Deltaproteobacteria bacterium]
METYTPKEAIERKISDFEFKYRLDIDLTDPSLWEGMQDEDQFYEFFDLLIDRVHELEFIYYGNSIKYLMENDASLNESIQMAIDCGFEIEKLNSELLATLHHQATQLNALDQAFEELNRLFNDYLKVK